MNYNEEIVNTNFYRKLNQTLRTRLPIIEIEKTEQQQLN